MIMSKTILITGATDGIGLETAKLLVEQGHNVVLHGRSPDKLDAVEKTLRAMNGGGEISRYVADLSRLADVRRMADEIAADFAQLDVLINNAGVLKTAHTRTEDGFDVRFMVNTIAPYLLTQRLLLIIPLDGRVVNLSSAAQAPVSIAALQGKEQLDDMAAYAQSKLAITMWTREFASRYGASGVVFSAVNPGSLLASKMVKEGFGVAGNDLSIGADILVRAALSEEFSNMSGRYYDNDNHRFAPPQADGLDDTKMRAIVEAIEGILDSH